MGLICRRPAAGYTTLLSSVILPRHCFVGLSGVLKGNLSGFSILHIVKGEKGNMRAFLAGYIWNVWSSAGSFAGYLLSLGQVVERGRL